MSGLKKKFIRTVPAYDEYHWETSDGQTFADRFKAEDHQMYLDGTKKTCDKCNGSKGFSDWGEDGRLPERFVKCSKCQGKGYLIKTEVWE